MGFWTGIKRALNSTLDKPYFRSLDDIILGTKTLVASDENGFSLEPLTSVAIIPESGEVLINKFEMYLSGSIRLYLKGSWSVNGSGYDLHGEFYASIYNNGKLIKKQLLAKKNSGGSENNVSFGVPCEIKANIGDIIEVKYYCGTGFKGALYLYAEDNKVCAEIKEIFFKNV